MSLRDYLFYEGDGVTLYCGDARVIVPMLCMNTSYCFEACSGMCQESVAIVTDPPYGIAYRHGARKDGRRLGFDEQTIQGDDTRFNPTPLLGFPYLILWGANHYADRLPASRGWLTWDKRAGITVNDQSDCEHAWTNFLTTARLFSKYWNGGGISEARYHPNQKPVSLMEWCLSFVPAACIIVDPYAGSGSTLVAAKNLSRRAIGIEIEPRYCEIAVERLRQGVLL